MFVEDLDPKFDRKWLCELKDVFVEHLNEVPPSRNQDHEIKILPGNSLVSNPPDEISNSLTRMPLLFACNVCRVLTFKL